MARRYRAREADMIQNLILTKRAERLGLTFAEAAEILAEGPVTYASSAVDPFDTGVEPKAAPF